MVHRPLRRGIGWAATAWAVLFAVAACSDSTVTPGEGGSCAAGLVACDGACVDTQFDARHCGACGAVCGDKQVCSFGQCGVECLGGTLKCGAKCVDTTNDRAHCGGCDKPCADGEVCAGGSCSFDCVGGTVECGAKCVDTMTDPANCGGCGKACAAEEVCTGGSCAIDCAGGTIKCGGQCVETASNPLHCGGCNNACPAGQVCVGGSCLLSCTGGTTKCGAKCVSLDSDAEHCGACNKACAAGEVCSGKQCATTCGGGTTKCGAKCVDMSIDPNNCGGCGNACASAAGCQGGQCAYFSSCKAIKVANAGAGDGVYKIDPDGLAGATAPLDAYCEMTTLGGGWALLFNSIGDPNGATTTFWQIPYASRFAVKGAPAPASNYYAGLLYLHAVEYRDEIVDLNDKAVEVFRAVAFGIDGTTMAMQSPVLVSGNGNVYGCQFAAGWAAADGDFDSYAPGNCAAIYSNATQHYCNCWYYNLGSDADSPELDAGWGPHLHSPTAGTLGLASDGSGYTRVNRIRRWARW